MTPNNKPQCEHEWTKPKTNVWLCSKCRTMQNYSPDPLIKKCKKVIHTLGEYEAVCGCNLPCHLHSTTQSDTYFPLKDEYLKEPPSTIDSIMGELRKRIFYHVVAWMEDEGDYQPTQEEAEGAVDDILRQALSKVETKSYADGYADGAKVYLQGKTVDEAVYQDIRKEERQRILGVIEGMAIEYEGCKEMADRVHTDKQGGIKFGWNGALVTLKDLLTKEII